MKSVKLDKGEKKKNNRLGIREQPIRKYSQMCSSCMVNPCDCNKSRIIRSMKFDEKKDYTSFFFSLK